MRLIHCAAAALVAAILGGSAPAALAGVLAVSIGADDAVQREAYKALVNDFRVANPDVEVHLTLTDTPGYRKSLPPSLESDGAPDVFTWFAGEQMHDMALRGELDDLSDLWKANTWWNTFPSAAATVAGRQVALPYQVYPWGLFFRRDVLERAGLHEAPRDLSGVLAACSKLRRAGFTPIALGGRDGGALSAWFDFIDMRANGYDYHAQVLDGKVSYNDGGVRRAFSMWRQLVDGKCFDANAVSLDARGAEALLYAGRAGMILSGTVASASFPEIVRPQIGYARFPTIDSGQPAAEAAPTDTFHIAARARNKADARRFLKFAAGNSADGKLAQSLGSFPTNKFAPVAGSVLDLASYKVLTEARGKLVLGYDREVPAGMAAEGVRAFQEFLVKPTGMYELLTRLDGVRATAYASAPARDRRGRDN